MIKIGQGIDIHKLVEGRDLVLGTIKIDYEYGLLGVSDADCLTHAIVDALIGAMGLGDIGKFFPDTDMKYKDISSSFFLKEIKKVLDDNNYKIINIDSTIVLEKPIIKDYIEPMRKSIASYLDIDYKLINIKATRGEGLGFVGKGEGICALANVLIEG